MKFTSVLVQIRFCQTLFLLGTSASSTDARRNVPGHNLLVQMGLVN